MEISYDGRFTHTITGIELSKGLRPSKRNPRNSGFLVECSGAVGKDGILQILEDLARLNTSSVSFTFPYPQIFVFMSTIIVCGPTKIYEWVANALVEKLTVTTGQTWDAIDFYDYIYMSNGVVSVVRDSGSKVYAVSTLPVALAICNFNGQVIIGTTGI
jgi:hypothetical protein